VEREFPAGASEMTTRSRAGFCQLMSPVLLAGLGRTGCGGHWRRFTRFPRSRKATSKAGQVLRNGDATRATAVPLLAKSNTGRPTKLEGNAEHPDSNGSTDRYTQASISTSTIRPGNGFAKTEPHHARGGLDG